MGQTTSANCQTDPSLVDEKSKNRAIQKQLKQNFIDEQQFMKLLLLGTGESGKSTIFKQVRKLYTEEQWETDELRDYSSKIYANINWNIMNLIAAVYRFKIRLRTPSLLKHFVEERGEGYSFTYSEDHDIMPQVARNLKALWNDPGIQKVWELRSDYQVFDNMEYYMSHIDRIGVGRRAFIPKFQDVLHCRVRTAGVTHIDFRMYGTLFKMYDVGGQRSERKKWINCFDHVVTIIFVAAVNEYDQFLFEDAKTNRTEEAVKVWEDIVNRKVFTNVGFVLFLNKWDLFQKKVLEFPYRDPLKGLNMDYKGPDPIDVKERLEKGVLTDANSLKDAVTQCADHARDKFYDVIDVRTGYGTFACHFTTATSTEGMNTVFEKCQEQILRKHLVRQGFQVLQYSI